MNLSSFLTSHPDVGSANLSDVLDSLKTMNSSIKPVGTKELVFGPAFTIQAYPGSIITVHKALTEARPGDVLVVAGEGAVDAGALLGEIMARECMRRGFAGIVIDGAVRDSAGILELGFPVYSAGITPRVGTNRRLGRTGVEISCAGQLIRPGDLVVADADGVVIVPQNEIEATQEKLAALLDKEQQLMQQIDDGAEIADLLNMRKEFNQ